MKLESLDISTLRDGYGAGAFEPAGVVAQILDRIDARGNDSVWIHRVARPDAMAAAGRQKARLSGGARMPLYGIPFAVKDNVDVAGIPTTAGCPAFSYVPRESAPVVERLLEAGAILIGKTNMDQFAAGLVGTRSPHGACASAFDSRYIAGGSSAGSAVAVSAGLVSFSLGTDTAGSGRVPAAFNNIVGWKPTRGLLSTRGVVPACRSLDCMSVFSLTCADSQAVGRVVAHFDPGDPFARSGRGPASPLATPFRFGVPAPAMRAYFGDAESPGLFENAIERLQGLGGTPVEIDFAPFVDAAGLLYSGPWVAERLAAIAPFFAEHSGSIHPVTAGIIAAGASYSAVDAFNALYRLQELRRRTEAEWAKMDVLILPTAPTTYTIAEVEGDPVQLNSNLGYYTNFVNLLDLCAVAVPSGFGSKGLPFGISLIAPAFSDQALVDLAGRYHFAVGGKVGATRVELASLPAPSAFEPGGVNLAVVGAHLRGQPLNPQLTDRKATFVRTAKTAPHYRLYALGGTIPPKPGLVRVGEPVGRGIEVELWNLSEEAFGSFTALVPPPLAIGTLQLSDGSAVKGFICEPIAVENAEDITGYGGWRAYLESKRGA